MGGARSLSVLNLRSRLSVASQFLKLRRPVLRGLRGLSVLKLRRPVLCGLRGLSV
jgi:hypothetical protein